MDPFTKSAGSKAIDQREHNEGASAKRVVIRYQDPNDGQWYNQDPHETRADRFDYDTTENIIYVGDAPVGSVDGDSVWNIEKFNLTDGTNATGKWALGVAWSDHLTETYL